VTTTPASAVKQHAHNMRVEAHFIAIEGRLTRIERSLNLLSGLEAVDIKRIEQMASDIEDLKTAMDEMKTAVGGAVSRINALLDEIHQSADDSDAVKALIAEAKDETKVLNDAAAAGTFSPSGN
jgi:archaellum component FlaC